MDNLKPLSHSLSENILQKQQALSALLTPCQSSHVLSKKERTLWTMTRMWIPKSTTKHMMKSTNCNAFKVPWFSNFLESENQKQTYALKTWTIPSTPPLRNIPFMSLTYRPEQSFSLPLHFPFVSTQAVQFTKKNNPDIRTRSDRLSDSIEHHYSPLEHQSIMTSSLYSTNRSHQTLTEAASSKSFIQECNLLMLKRHELLAPPGDPKSFHIGV